jgi:predicted outer membrane repeat protein
MTLAKRLSLLSLVAALIAVTIIVISPITPAYAATATVSSLADTNVPGTLRNAIDTLNGAGAGPHTINFDAAVFSTPQTIQLTTSLPQITTQITINGNGNGTIRGEGAADRYSAFRVQSGGSLTLNNLTITNAGGSANGGERYGAIINNGTLVVNNSTFTNNIVVIDGDNVLARGGAIFNTGTATISGSTFTGNQASGSGNNSLAMGATIYSRGTLTVINSTFSNNSSANDGGAIYADAASGAATIIRGSTFTLNSAAEACGALCLLHNSVVFGSTISDNTAQAGGGIFVFGNANAVITNTTISGNDAINGGGVFLNTSAATLTNVTIANNSATSGGGGIFYTAFGGSPVVRLRNSIVASNTAPSSANISGTIPTVEFSTTSGDPSLGALANNGGSTLTHLPQSGSPVVNAGNNNFLNEATTGVDYNGNGAANDVLSTDQRGQPRAIGTVDQGAVEILPTATVVSVTRADANPTNASSVVFTVTLNQSFSDVLDGSVSNNFQIVTTGSISGAQLVTVSHTTGTNQIGVLVNTGTGEGTIGIHVIGDSGLPIDLTNLPFTSGEVYTIDKTAPTVTINQAAAQADPTNAQPIAFDVVFSEPVSNFTSTDVALTGSTADVSSASINIIGSGATYTVQVSGVAGDGSVIASISAGTVTDAAGNTNTASTSTDNRVTYRPLATVVSVTRADANPTNAGSVNFLITLSANFSDFASSGITNDVQLVTTGSITGASIFTISTTNGTNQITVSVNTGTGQGTIGLEVIGDSGLPIDLTNLPFTTGEVYTIDRAAPTVTINQAAAQVDPTNAQPIVFDVGFSEPVYGFNTTDVSLVGSTADVSGASVSVLGSGATYTVQVSGVAGSGTVVASIAAGAVADGVGNLSTASTSTDNTVTYTPTATVVSITRDNPSPTNANTVDFTVTISQNYSTNDLTLLNDFSVVASPGISGAAIQSINHPVGSNTLTVRVNAGTGSGTIGIQVIDDSSFPLDLTNLPFTAGEIYTIDKTPPTVTINQAVGQVDPTLTLPIPFDVLFSEPVSGFESADVSLVGSTADVSGASINILGSGTTYTVQVSGVAGNGTVVASIPASTTTDPVGNLNTASTSTDNTVTYFGTLPDVTITRADANPTNAASVNFNVVFTEAVTGLSVGNFDLNASGVTGTLITSVSGSGTTYTITISTGTGNGTIRLDMINDSALNKPVANVPYTFGEVYTIDKDAPTATINQAAGQADPTALLPVTFDVLFSESVSGFEPADISLAGSTADVSGATVNITGSGATYSVQVSGVASTGTVVASILAGAAADVAGNTNTASTSTDNTVTYDTTIPSAGITRADANPTSAAAVRFTVTFSQDVTGVDTDPTTQNDFEVITSGTLSGVAITTISGSGTTYIVIVNTGTGSGTLRLNLNDDDTVVSTVNGVPLGGVGVDNGDVTGPEYIVRPVQAASPPVFPTPQTVPLCALLGGGTNGIVRTSVPAGMNADVFCRVLVENSIYVRDAAEIGDLTLINAVVLQAVDVFGFTGNGVQVTAFNQPILVCLQGTGRMFFRDATSAPRVTVPLAISSNNGYTCAAIPNAGTLVLVR